MPRPGVLLSINTSTGGVPKFPRHEASVGPLGVEGDRQRDLVHHGGPDRAVCLYSFDLIRALQREGHTPSIGLLGENLTVAGVDWSAVTPGARVTVGDVRLAVTGYAVPCRNLSMRFDGVNVSRISQKLHPGWSRAYARVERPGVVRMGDAVHVVAQDESSGPPWFAEGHEAEGAGGGGAAGGGRTQPSGRVRVQRSGVLHVATARTDAFRFFTPDGERLWVPGWDPEYLHPQSGEQGAGAIFETTHNNEHTLWLVLRLSPAEGVAEYARITPGSRFGVVRVITEAAGPSSTRVTVTYDLTAVSNAGDDALRALSVEAFGGMVADWEARIGRCLEGEAFE